jgi:predicted N-acetyltransferase YhbS
MTVRLRPASPDDAEPAGAICYEAFETIAEQHGFPPDVTSASDTTDLISVLLSRPDIYSIIAEIDGRVVGSNFLWEADTVAGVGPITVDPGVQNKAIGRQLMEAVLERARQQGISAVRQCRRPIMPARCPSTPSWVLSFESRWPFCTESRCGR